MPYVAFHLFFPEIAEKETRTVTVLRKTGDGLPPGDYSFLELFCDEPACDCRRVFLSVISSRRKMLECVIAYGWESRDFYVRWMGDDEPVVIDTLHGASLNMTSPQSDLAPAILELFKKVLLQDGAYIVRIKRHYQVFRDRIDEKSTNADSSKVRGKRKTGSPRKHLRS